MATIKKHDPKDYANLEKPENAAKLKQIEATAKKTAEEELKLALQQNISEPEELAKHLSQERIKMIQEGLIIPTYVLTIRREGDNSFVDITRNDEKFMPSMMLASKKDIEQITPLQIASIVNESILFLAQAIGIHHRRRNQGGTGGTCPPMFSVCSIYVLYYKVIYYILCPPVKKSFLRLCSCMLL